jgi:folate-binding protein YgfZ
MDMRGYEALRSRSAWLDLAGRGAIVVTGEDRARLLHAICTNNVQQLKPGEGCYAFFLNAQGRILADATIFCREDHLLLDTEPETRASLYQHIDKYIIADDVMLEDVSDRMTAIALEGPEALSTAAALGVPVPEAGNGHAVWNSVLAARVTYTGQPGLRFFVPREQKAQFAARLEAAGTIAADAEAARVVRIEQAKPRYGEDISEAYLAQETQQMQALSFTKGCYLGQEIVERVRSRGLVHRLLVGLAIDTTEAPGAGAEVLLDDNKAGKITSAVWSPGLAKCVAMAYVRREHATPGTRLAVLGHAAEVRPLHLA